MNISVISFTEGGGRLAERIREALGEKEKVTLYTRPKEGVTAWAGRQFQENNALIFVGACGIAVRAIAPFVKDKLEDSPVLVLDEAGRYVIPLLSGHAGGANELALKLASRLLAEPVLTTATDVRGVFAVDVFAKKNFLTILNKEGIAKVSAKLLRGETISVAVEGISEWTDADRGLLPKGLEPVPYPPSREVDLMISSEEVSARAVLTLKPKEYVLGIGCRRGKSEEEIEGFLQKELKKLGLKPADLAFLASIDRKKEEPGICAWAAHHRIPYRTFSVEELLEVEGSFHGSAFVKETVGVDNVCERAALVSCGPGGVLVLEKQAENGMTLAVAKRTWSIQWKGWAENEA